MKLFKISQIVNTGYDTYSDAVVAAPDMETARNMSPSYDPDPMDEWTKPENVTVEYLGEAAPHLGEGFICKSYHAG